MPADRPISATECAVTSVRSGALALPYAVVRPYSTCESLLSFVVHAIVAPEVVIDIVETPEITGGVASFETMTEMTGDVRELPAASVAIADNVWEPFDAVSVSHEIAYGALVRSAPRFAPSSRN